MVAGAISVDLAKLSPSTHYNCYMMQSANWNGMPESARLWVYTASRDLTTAECEVVRDALNAFIASWQAHGADLAAAWQLTVSNRVLLIAVDESVQPATGCSIDASVGFLKSLGEQLGACDWFDRNIIMYQAPTSAWQAARLHEFWALRKAGVVQDDTILCDATVRVLGDWNRQGIIAFDQTWHQQMWL
jgi:hypothetical protein